MRSLISVEGGPRYNDSAGRTCPMGGFALRQRFSATMTTSDDIVVLPIDGVLDLHTFQPRDVKNLVPDYLEECRLRGILEVRIIHGKGTGTLRKTVHSILDRLTEVVDYRLGGIDSGSWGATLVTLRPLEKK
ncbi:MAG TPA: Smr/MutS family protein [Polyangiaceae bacterium]|nr:Smr/MutS family protein [Polyangiaceae bacterium]HNZ24213.1 Smr/MutS family protein [Polyangiaceae bacterium]HOD22570.1 Smr/MutS family protein [Polyangiaceae bacterium]HOE49434.1 Smr/MutS family protein [Polyangiaceae bacterium]HOH01126.1 Smr/MutS family protein [Polyangiaceae bacterium]